ncbi:amino acid ABC transporter substrate-binding protein [Acetobacteraceae bacterium H6797]|nr:amino acid ABC transporter substrate-binding protein [Acetobacteraceae bacterium H6797]
MFFRALFVMAGVMAGAVAGAALGSSAAQAGPTLDAVKARGTLKCGTLGTVPGFAAPDSAGRLKGMDADFCRAVAAAVLGDANKVTFVSTTVQTRFATLQSGEIDVLFANNTWTMSRDTTLGLLFAPPTYYDGQGVMVTAASGLKSLKEMDGAAVCVTPGSSSELNITDWFRTNKMSFRPVVIENNDAARAAFFAGRCDAFTGDQSYLASIRSQAAKPGDYVILPEIISKSPLAPVVRQGDDQWLNIVKWVVYATIIAEERDLTQANVASRADDPNPEVKRLLGGTPGLSKGLGLADDWVKNVIAQVGNYGEIFERNIGPKTPLALPRGMNKLSRDGGLQFAPLFI